VRAASARVAGLVVRRATAEDVPALTALRLALLREEGKSPLFAHPRADAAARARQLSASQIAGIREAVFVAERQGSIVAMLRCVVSRGAPLVRGSRHGLLTSAYVRPSARRQGVLAALVKAAEEWCRSRGLRELRLHCTVENIGGNAAWTALGFTAAEVLLRREIPVREAAHVAKIPGAR
jgi:GNAT superfamily N-acetyltransferase